MEAVYELRRSKSPLLVSIPHSGTAIPAEVSRLFSEQALLLNDTDWFIPELYDFILDADVSVIRANYSRLLIDLNRPPDNTSLYPGTATTSLCPLTLFDGHPVYNDDSVLTENEIERRTARYWQPYHQALAEEITRIRSEHGFCILYDAHSIRSEVPGLFENKLPDLNLGTNHGLSCDPQLQKLLEDSMEGNLTFTSVSNGRFIGGYITRHYGSPEQHCHALQMEIAQSAYMDEIARPEYDEDKALTLKVLLQDLLTNVCNWHPE